MSTIKYIYLCDDCDRYSVFVNEENDNPNKICKKCGSSNIKYDDYIDVEEVAKRKHGTPLIECPYCHSKDTKKISALNRATSFGFFGFGSGKIGKQWHCNKCGSDF